MNPSGSGNGIGNYVLSRRRMIRKRGDERKMTIKDGQEFVIDGKTFVYIYTGSWNCDGCDAGNCSLCPDCACGFVLKEKKNG